MLVGKTKSVRGRIAAVLFATVAVTVIGIALAALGAVAGLWEWPPQPSGRLGVPLGLVAGLIVLFEMAILPRKWLRGRRFGSTRTWMRWHVWLGLVCLPVVLVHAGFGSGGPLTTATLALFLIVTASGVWGLVMQQWLPQKLIDDVPDETIGSQIDFVGDYHADEATRLVDGLVSDSPVADGAADLLAFRDDLLVPYLRGECRPRSPLASPAEAARRFARLRESVPPAVRSVVERLRELADRRRQWDAQARIHFWLHNWLLVHLPLSVAMTVLMSLHAWRALKFW